MVSQMTDLRASPPYLVFINLSAAWRSCHIASKWWQCPCGKVVRIVHGPNNKVFGIRCLGA